MDNQNELFPPKLVVYSEKEKITNEGEDSYAYSFVNMTSGYMAAFDGCGGMGAKKYPSAGNRSGAKLASLIAAFITDRFYSDMLFRFDHTDAERLCVLMSEKFRDVKKGIDIVGGFRIGGNMFRELPTTVSMVAMQMHSENELLCEYIWAGDSRGYFLDQKGLCQVTEDDLDTDEDAFSNLRSDAKLSNVVNADTDFVLHEKQLLVSSPALIISASDGAFGYYNTPMEFEFLLLHSMMHATDLKQWGMNLTAMVVPYTGDDFTILIAGYGFSDLQSCKAYYQERYQNLFKEYIQPMQKDADEDAMMQLWMKYRTNYYRR